MNLVHEGVDHIKFGHGVVTEINGDNIAVEFQDQIGTKKFIYPDAFDKFLRAVNPEVQSTVMEEWFRKKEQLELERERIRKEREAAELEEIKKKLESKRAELAKKKLAAKSRKKQPKN